MMSLKLQKGEDVTIVADGQDEDAAVSGVATFFRCITIIQGISG